MGNCGCGDFSGAIWAVTVGNHHVLAVSEYDGCEYCDGPLGFTVHLLTKAAAKEWCIEPSGAWTPEAPLGWSEHFLNMFSQGQLATAAQTIQDREKIDLSEYDSLGGLLRDIGLDVIHEALRLQRELESDLAKRSESRR